MTDAAELRQQLRAYALSLPEAYEDHPWGESVAKVGKKVFAFFGVEPPSQWPVAFTVKLPETHAMALSQPGVKPTGYGLGRAGWVTVDLAAADLPFDLLREWIDESYRAIAPKRLAVALEGRSATDDATD